MLKNLLVLVVLSLAFVGFFTVFKLDAGIKYAAHIETIPSVRMFGASPAVEKNISKFGVAAGAAIGLIAFIVSVVIFGILKIVRVPSAVASGISNLLSYSGVAGLGYELVYLEEKNSALASAVVYYIGKPLFFSGIIVSVLAVIFLIASLVKKKDIPKIAQKAAMILIIISPFVLSGCSLLGDVTQAGCVFAGGGKNAAHCYQEAAVQKNDEKVCDKAPQGEEFKKLGSNPPQDKCYYMVAENKRDPEVCKKIKGGMLSYAVSECGQTVLDSAEKEINDTLKKSDGGKKLSPEELVKIQSQMEKYNKMNDIMSNMTKNIHDMNMSAVKNLRN
jgi:hypothetical protein